MDDCPIPFGAKLPSPVELLPAGFLWNYQNINLQLCLKFNEQMDNTFTPAPSDFILLVDGVPKTPDSIAWSGVFVLEINYSQAALNPSNVNLELPESVGPFHSITFVPVSPFDIVGEEQTATAHWDSAGDDFILTVTMNFNMIENSSAPTDPMNVTFVGFDGSPDAVEIFANGTIDLLFVNENPPLGTMNLTFGPPNGLYRKANGLNLCSFFINNIMEA